MLKKISWGILLILIALCLYYWNWLSYGYNQAKGQLKVITQSRPIEDFLQDPNFPDSLKQKLELTMAVRGFAVDGHTFVVGEVGVRRPGNSVVLCPQL